MTDKVIIHLAIPSDNIQRSVDFYMKLGAKLGRRTETWAIFNFSGIQLVCHKVDIVAPATMYPRHFGLILADELIFNSIYGMIDRRDLFEDLFVRFKGQPAEHETFFLKDPSNNVIEFKWYRNKESIFGS